MKQTFTDLVDACTQAFLFLTTEYSFQVSRTASNARGFEIDFKATSVGVRVAYEIRDPLSVKICVLEDSEFPKSLGEIHADDQIREFDLRDLEAVAGTEHTAEDSLALWSIPSREVLEEQAARLRTAGSAFLAGDIVMVPALQARVMKRAEAAAREKWHDKASDFGW